MWKPRHARIFPPPAARKGQAKPKRWKDKGLQPRCLLTGNGDVQIQRRYYWRAVEGGRCPADGSLGVDGHGISPRARETCCLFAVMGSFREAVEHAARYGNIPISQECLRRVVEREAGLIAAGREDGSIAPGLTAADAKVEAVARIYVGMDGVFVRMVTEAEKLRRRTKVEAARAGMTPERLAGLAGLPERRQGHGDKFKEMKLCVFYTQDGKHKHTFVTSGDSKRAGALLKKFASQVEFHKAHERIGIVDGAVWIRTEMDGNLPALSMMLLDYFHLSQHVYAAAEVCLGAGEDAKAWAGARMEEFKKRGAAEPLAAMKALLKTRRSASRRQALCDLIGYVEKRLDMLRYPEAIARGWDIGSGPTEAQCKTHTLRLKISGAKWDPENAAGIMNLLALQNSGQWKPHWAKMAA